jgi:hypothetical protein
MSPHKVVRENVATLTDLPNIGKASAADLRLLGIESPSQLKGRDPYEMHETLCRITRIRHDPCMIDVFISVTRFMNGGAPREWWAFTEERKRTLSDTSRAQFPNAPR